MFVIVIGVFTLIILMVAVGIGVSLGNRDEKDVEEGM